MKGLEKTTTPINIVFSIFLDSTAYFEILGKFLLQDTIEGRRYVDFSSETRRSIVPFSRDKDEEKLVPPLHALIFSLLL